MVGTSSLLRTGCFLTLLFFIDRNHFRQSYMMQFHKVMYPVFARLGVKLVTRNMAQGGMGTLHSSLGSGSIYGDDVDLLLWDSGTYHFKQYCTLENWI